MESQIEHVDAAQKEMQMTHLHALVVGINIYKSEKLKNYPLRGCVNDVDRMSLVLKQMFADELHLLTLTEAQASRAAIFESFRSHLIEPAKIWVQSGRVARACFSVSLQRPWLIGSRCDANETQWL